MVSLWSLVVVVGLVISVSVTVLAVECNEENEGKIVERGCWGYVRCVDGEAVVTSCAPGSVFNTVSRKCVDQVGITANCGLCEGKSDGIYADNLEDCKEYFVCVSEVVTATGRCSYNLVYDEKTMKCNIPFLVLPPCGTRGQ